MVTVAGVNLRNKTNPTKSCGCLKRENGKAKTTHGCEPFRLYRCWESMRSRCKSHPRYIERNITICEEWNAFEPFRDWALANGYRSDLTLDRIDNDGNYEPANCRWATYKVQSRNSSHIRSVIRSDGYCFPTIIDAAQATPCASHSGVSAVCNGRRKYHAGYSWSFA